MSDQEQQQSPGEAAEEAGIVDQQAAAVDAMEDAEGDEEESGS